MKQAAILVGGKGTRLGVLAKHTPKPLIDIKGKPFIQIVIEEVARHGVSQIILLCGHLAWKIYGQFHEQTIKGAKVLCVVEDEPMGTGGALLQVANMLDEEFLLLNGDSLFYFNILDLKTIAPGKEWQGKVALRLLDETGRFGIVEVESEQITSFSEKSGKGRGLINAGVYLLKRTVLDLINTYPCSLEHDILPNLAASGSLFGRAYSGYFIDIGIPVDLIRAQEEIPVRRWPTMFFDRDGVLNHDHGYVHSIKDFEWIEGAVESIKLLNDLGWLVIVLTNQAGIARGYYKHDDVNKLHHWIQDELMKHGAHVDAFYFCPHHPAGIISDFAITCNCRKPEPGMLIQALNDWPIHLEQSYLIGDKLSDIQAAQRANIANIFFKGKNLHSIVLKIVENNRTG